MSIQNEIERIKFNVSSAYDAIADKGGELPDTMNSDNLAITIQSIPSHKGSLSIHVTAPSGSTVTAEKDGNIYTSTEESGSWDIQVPDYGTYIVKATLGENSVEKSVYIEKQNVVLEYKSGIYGVEWDGTADHKCSRTDDAKFFVDPDPYVADGNHPGSSPFDTLYPWSDMVKVDDQEAGVMVKIPKFWYKLEQIGIYGVKVQISDHEYEGYNICPACMSRDGVGPRDYVLVGRYHCASNTYKSTAKVKPQVSTQQSVFRNNIHLLGSNIYMIDFATMFTIWLLYIVEFADWNSQATIGMGCSETSVNTADVFNMGYTDDMPYHTGTTQTSRYSYGGTQYRYIEGLWDNCCDRLTGCYNSSNGLMVEVNPKSFAENSGGESVGTPTSGWISGLKVTESGPFQCFISNSSNGGENIGLCDKWSFSSSSPVISIGAWYAQASDRGMFCVDYSDLSNAGGGRGSRPMKVPTK